MKKIRKNKKRILDILAKRRGYHRIKRAKRVRQYRFIKKLVKKAQRESNVIREEIDFVDKFQKWGKSRKKFLKLYYSKLKFTDSPRAVNITKSFGIEYNVDDFFEIAQELTRGFPKKIDVNLHGCQRLWPSAVMLLASYHHWFLIKSNAKQDVVIHSQTNSELTEYISFSGLKDYITLTQNSSYSQNCSSNKFDASEIVPLKRETTKESYQLRFAEIVSLVKEHSSFDDNQLEIFQDRILNELFINLSEHGVNYRALGHKSADLGWYLIAQVHKTSGFLTICLGDNGIGVANSLKTGPQSQILSKELKLDKAVPTKVEELLLKKSLEKDVSGAYDAQQYDKYVKFIKLKEKGRSRGMGFSRIIESSKALDVQFSILSNNGFLRFDKNNGIDVRGFKEKIFVGTMFNLILPIKTGVNNVTAN